mmetsp:Transcript_14697/g.14794  ORF Transcript_14697/g.14794 Transcript_14697/m.14794 type:complete len:160 (-) Transcript_14697:118-597(-)
MITNGKHDIDELGYRHTKKVERVVEFFSGIGGWRCALEAYDSSRFDIIAAYDISPAANDTYLHNYNHKPLTKSIESVSVKELDDYKADLWVMSPPCQPYTRNNTTEKRDKRDPRSCALSHLSLSLSLSNYNCNTFSQYALTDYYFFSFLSFCLFVTLYI